MLNTTFGLKTAVCLTASVLLGASTYGAIIYDNTADFNLGVTAEGNGVEHGDVVIFAGTDRLLTTFQFEYFLGTNPGGTLEGNEMAQIFLRAMDGPDSGVGTALPGTLLYSSTAFNIGAGYHTVNADQLNIQVGDSLAWTVSFTGIEADENAGLLFTTDSTPVGTNPTILDPAFGNQQHFSIRRAADGTWDVLNHGAPGGANPPDNFASRFTAIPEPGTWAIMLGGLAALGLMRRRKS